MYARRRRRKLKLHRRYRSSSDWPAIDNGRERVRTMGRPESRPIIGETSVA